MQGLKWNKTTDFFPSSPVFPFFFGFSWSSVSLGAGSASMSLASGLEPTSIFPREKNKRGVMAIFVTLHPKRNFMGQREDTSVAHGDFLC